MRLVLMTLIVSNILFPAALCAQESFSSEETQVTRGVGFRQSNKFEFKYKERIKTYEDQIQMGLTRGWLSQADAEIFSSRLAKLKEMEASVSAKNYPKPELDVLEQEITKFNKEFSDAGQKKQPAPGEQSTVITKPEVKTVKTNNTIKTNTPSKVDAAKATKTLKTNKTVKKKQTK